MRKKTKLCYMDTDSCIVYIKTEDIYLDIAKDVETRFHALNYELDRPLPTRKHKKSIHKDIFACLFSIHNIISLSCHEQVSLSGLRFERYFSHHRAR